MKPTLNRNEMLATSAITIHTPTTHAELLQLLSGRLDGGTATLDRAVRNCVRKPIALGYIARFGRGSYVVVQLAMCADNDRETFGSKLRDLREAAGLSQSDVAEALNAAGFEAHATRGRYAKLEAGRTSVRADEIPALCDVFRVRPGEIVPDGWM